MRIIIHLCVFVSFVLYIGTAFLVARQLIATQEVLNELKKQEVIQKETLQHQQDFYKFEEAWKEDEDDLNDSLRALMKKLEESQ
jgi:hypothetical protein